MRLLEFFLQWRKAANQREEDEFFQEAEYVRGFERGLEIGLKMASQVDKMALDMAKTEGIEEVLNRFRESGNKTNS